MSGSARLRARRGSIGWGGFFVGLGAVPLAVALDIGPPPAIDDLTRLWPVILIVIGLGLILRWTAFGGAGSLIAGLVVGLVVGAFLAGGRVGPGCAVGLAGASGGMRGGTFASSAAAVSLDVACSDLDVRSAPGQDWSVSGIGPADGPALQSDETRLDVTLPASGRGRAGQPPISAVLPAGPQLDLSTTERFGSLRADLSGARLGRVAVQTAFSKVRIDLDGASLDGPLVLHASFGSGSLALPAGRVSGTIDNDFGSLHICLPPATPVRLTTHASFGSVRVADSVGLTRQGDVWQSADEDSSTSGIDLEVRTSFGSIDVTSGGC